MPEPVEDLAPFLLKDGLGTQRCRPEMLYAVVKAIVAEGLEG